MTNLEEKIRIYVRIFLHTYGKIYTGVQKCIRSRLWMKLSKIFTEEGDMREGEERRKEGRKAEKEGRALR